MKLSSGFILLGVVGLGLTTVLHMTGFEAAGAAATQSDGFTSYFFQPLWLFPIASWIVIGIAAIFTLRSSSKASRLNVLILSLVPIFHAAILFTYLGAFPGGFALGISGGLIMAGSFCMKTPVSDT